MRGGWWRILAFAAVTLLATFGLTAIKSQVQPAQAATASRFDPGLIISDSVFYDFGTMSVDQIQRFLNSKVTKCAATTGPTCLKDYRMDTPAKAASDGRCSVLEAKLDQSSAEIIHDIAVACGINPRVLLVVLQKEQGLVQASKPTAYMYRAALGYGCPDSKPEICGKGLWAGLFNQLHTGAGQFQWYGDPRGSFTYLKPGRTIKRPYSPNSYATYDKNGNIKQAATCGFKSFLLKSQATAALYYYTPYTPNASAMKNLYSTGDSCSAYGNRNFWRFYTDWFGSTIGGGFLLESDGSGTYLIIDDTKYPIEDPALVEALAPLGPLGSVSVDYLNSFKTGPVLNRLVKSEGGRYFFVDGGKKYPVDSCELAKLLGLNCDTAVTLSASQMAALVSGPTMTTLVAGVKPAPTTAEPNPVASDLYLIDNGVKREILDVESAEAAALHLSDKAPVSIAAFSNLPWGAPIARDGSYLSNRETGQHGVIIAGRYFAIDAATDTDFDFAKWFDASTGSLSGGAIHAIDTGLVVKSIVSDDAGAYYLLTPTGKRLISNGPDFAADATILPATLLARIPTLPEALSAPFFARAANAKTVYLVGDGMRRATLSAADRNRFKTRLAMPEVQVLAASALNNIVAGPVLLAPGALVKTNASAQLFLVDGYARALKLSANQAPSELSAAKVRTVTQAQLVGYSTKSKLAWLKVSCAGQEYLFVAGQLRPILSEYSRSYPSSAVNLDALTCEVMPKSSSALGRFITTPTGLIYLIQNQQKRLVPTKKQYLVLRGATPGAYRVSNNFAASIPIGKPVPLTVKTPIAVAGENPDPSPTASPTATPKPTVTPKPTPSATSALRYYRVRAGDTLTTIAKKFAVTVTALRTANKLTSDLIRIDQKLLIP